MRLARRQLLGGLAGLAISCETERPAVTSPVPPRFDLGARSLALLTWNIWMMPPWTRESPRNVERATAIATLVKDEYDILCFQKAFDPAARAAIEHVLGDRYAYRYGPANEELVLLNSGLWVLSRTPLALEGSLVFSSCRGIECFSRKGAMLLSGSCAGRPFRLVVTHLQGEAGTLPTAAGQAVRDAQLRQLRDELIAPNLEPGVPFFICGDLRTARFDGDAESPAYARMLETLGAENGGERRITFDDPEAGFHNELDYVLVRPNGARVTVKRALHPSELSYRHAVSASVRFA